MPSEQKQSADRPFCGGDLEKWRGDHGLTKHQAADAFGLQKAAWDELTSEENASKPLADPVVAMLLEVYLKCPKSSPVDTAPDIREFYSWLGLQDGNAKDYERFATLIGRAQPSVYRHLKHGGKPSRPVIRWMEAIYRLRLNSRQSLKVMTEVVGDVGRRQGAGDILSTGWESRATSRGRQNKD